MGMTKEEIRIARQRLRSLVLDCMCASNKSRRLLRRARGLIEEALNIESKVFRKQGKQQP